MFCCRCSRETDALTEDKLCTRCVLSGGLAKYVDKLDLQIMGARFSKVAAVDGDSALHANLETSDGRFRELHISYDHVSGLFEIRCNDHLIANLPL